LRQRQHIVIASSQHTRHKWSAAGSTYIRMEPCASAVPATYGYPRSL